MNLVLVAVMSAALGGGVGAVSAPAGYVPAAPKSALEAEFHPLPESLVSEYLDRVGGVTTYRVFEGRNEELKAAAPVAKLLTVGHGFDAPLEPTDLFQSSYFDGARHVFLGAVASTDAQAIRLRVDLSTLADDEWIWVVDPIEGRPFGPDGRADHLTDGRWLPTIEGDTAIVVARSARPDLPQARLLQVGHFFRLFQLVPRYNSGNVFVEDLHECSLAFWHRVGQFFDLSQIKLLVHGFSPSIVWFLCYRFV